MAKSIEPTIKRWAHEFFVRVSYVDIDGRNVGYDYEYILAELKKKFPDARTSKRWLRKMAYELNGQVRMPVRRRSRRALARGYAEALLLRVTDAEINAGLQYRTVYKYVWGKFPDHTISIEGLKEIERELKRRSFNVPVREWEVAEF